ncbi:hypothetical protein [Novosphingobium sp. AP12]|uniref:hypothetical protein n=1 Tax=Novosphingobium sp. AP12 TaxID=1144305 RepID=UPI000271F5B5|nr:hypothetical protein [Novosphingobium sp. AP12]EJL35188.1 hypothetical protein PMI02_00223 [Novosphingobium sp. AP12]
MARDANASLPHGEPWRRNARLQPPETGQLEYGKANGHALAEPESNSGNDPLLNSSLHKGKAFKAPDRAPKYTISQRNNGFDKLICNA